MGNISSNKLQFEIVNASNIRQDSQKKKKMLKILLHVHMKRKRKKRLHILKILFHIHSRRKKRFLIVRNEYRGFNVATEVVQRRDVSISYSVILTSSTYIYKSEAVLI